MKMHFFVSKYCEKTHSKHWRRTGDTSATAEDTVGGLLGRWREGQMFRASLSLWCWPDSVSVRKTGRITFCESLKGKDVLEEI